MSKKYVHSRREFVKYTSLAALGSAPIVGLANNLFDFNNLDDSNLNVHIFSKLLQFLDCKEAGEIAAELGFSGIDLTVRPKGHVLPELVKTDLPKAILDIKNAGSSCKLISTNIESVDNPLDVDIIHSAAKEGIEYYRTN